MTTLHDVDTARTRLRVRDSGEGFPLVMLHGWPESSYCWETTIASMGTGLRYLRPDLRGLGDSARDGDVAAYQKAELAADVLAALDAMGIGDFGLVGHDWGGAVAQEIAIAAPDRVRRLDVMNIHLLNNPAGYAAANKVHAAQLYRAYWYQYFQQTPGLAETMVPGNERTFLRVFLRGKDRDWAFPSDAVDEYVRCYSIPGTPASGANYYRAMRLDANRWKTLAGTRYPMPTALVYGVHDPVVVPQFLQHHETCFESVTLTEIAASHFVQEEQPEAVARALDAHFAALKI
ncbi:MAG: alpha/beta hydrolase [Pseudomonadota bacterium]